jgi:succinate dehydrogenase / fumarate reductase flavoprotein subunit
MRIYPAPHYTMGGLWVDYDLMSNVPGLFVIGEANFSDHGANRLGASALMQGLADGYFILPNTISNYLAQHMGEEPLPTTHAAFGQTVKETERRISRLLGVGGDRTVDSFHRELGEICWNLCGMSRSREGLGEALEKIPALREEYWHRVNVPGSGADLNQSLEKAGRLADFFELAELMCHDALRREESCGTHFRLEHQSPEGEAKRDDDAYTHVAAWEYQGKGMTPTCHVESLDFENVELTQRSYK